MNPSIVRIAVWERWRRNDGCITTVDHDTAIGCHRPMIATVYGTRIEYGHSVIVESGYTTTDGGGFLNPLSRGRRTRVGLCGGIVLIFGKVLDGNRPLAIA